MQTELATQNVLIARQPIFNSRKQVVAYELLSRTSDDNKVDVVDGDLATGSVLVNAFINLGMENVVGDKLAFVNFTHGFLFNNCLIPDTPRRIVLEILEDIVPDDELIERVRFLSDHGFTIALDDYVQNSNLTPLLSVADIVKVELPAVSPEELPQYVENLRAFPVKLLAEKVETHEEFEACRQTGFDLFQGFFMAFPENVRGRRIADNQFSALRVFLKLNDPNVELKDLEPIICTDAIMSYSILRFINSAHHGLRREVASIRQALTFLGIRGIQNIVALMTLERMSQGKPLELLRMAFIRAQMAMLLGQKLQHESPAAFFTAGLFSLLDAVLDTPMPQLLACLPLEDWIVAGLEGEEGPLADVLRCVKAFERADFDNVALEPLNLETIGALYWEATKRAQIFDAVVR